MNSNISENWFNEKYKDHIEKGHYGCDIYLQEALEYLDKEFEELIKIDGFKFSQIKSKFNFFCFYCDNVSSVKVNEIENKLKEIYSEHENNRRNNS
jgi:hypothetical protein